MSDTIMFGLLMLGVGIYLGMYLDQNYQIPRVDDFEMVRDRIKELLKNYMKD